MGDLFAQCQTYATTDFPNFWSIGNTLMYPLDTSTLSMRLTLINADATGLVFSVPTGGSQVSGTGFTAIPAGAYVDPSLIGLVPPNGQVVMSETKDTYNSPVSIVVNNALTFTSKFYLTPRQVTVIPVGAACTS